MSARRSPAPVLGAYLLVASLAATLPACGDRPGEDAAAGARPRVVIVGLDGADWQVIRPLAEAGRLPAFERLLREGASGILRSMEPSASPSLWTTVATGVSPGRHGIHGFVVGGGEESDVAAGRRRDTAPGARRRSGPSRAECGEHRPGTSCRVTVSPGRRMVCTWRRS
jgi:hypothetical protein